MSQQNNGPRDFERSRLIDVTPGVVFDYISDMGNLPAYVPTVQHAEPQGEDRVNMEVSVHGHRVEERPT